MRQSLLPQISRSIGALHALLKNTSCVEAFQVRFYQATQNNWEHSALNQVKGYRAIPPPLKKSPWLGVRSSILRRHYDEQQRKYYYWAGLCSFLVLSGAFILYGLGLVQVGNKHDGSYTVPVSLQFLARFASKLKNMRKALIGSSREKLLPDILADQKILPKYTLVIELMDVLVHPEWTEEMGWLYKKRPWVEYFLRELRGANIEVVVFTDEHGMIAFPIIDALDPNRLIAHRLVAESAEYIEGKHVKNLDYLNRDLSKVIVVDWNPKSVSREENALVLPRWEGEDDSVLQDLALFLKELSLSDVQDTRQVLSHYRQFQNPVEVFKKEYSQFHKDQAKKEANEVHEKRLYLQKWTQLTARDQWIKKLI